MCRPGRPVRPFRELAFVMSCGLLIDAFW